MTRERVVVESPLAGDVARNMRYAAWCCRVLVDDGKSPLASHFLCPWFLDDAVPTERTIGIDCPWVWQPDVEHVFFIDHGVSRGMIAAMSRCTTEGIPLNFTKLITDYPGAWDEFNRGAWPPHTKGFEVVR